MPTSDVLSSKLLPGSEGTHLLGEWYGCDFSTPTLNDLDTLRSICLFVTSDSGLEVVGDVFHKFQPQGVTGTVLLAESHLAIHTWPESMFTTLDVYVCNIREDNTSKAIKLYNTLKEYFHPQGENFSRVQRGRKGE